MIYDDRCRGVGVGERREGEEEQEIRENQKGEG